MKKFLTQNEKERVAEAVREAELKTSGEIATAIIEESSSYAEYELLFATITTIVVSIVLTLLYPQVYQFIQSRLWEITPLDMVKIYSLSYLIIFTISYFIFNTTFLNRLLIPKNVKEKRVYRRALVHFVEAGVVETVDRTGILIFISQKEKMVQLIADKGINEKISQEQWDSIVSEIIDGIKDNRIADGIIKAVEMCGKLLSEHFPIKEDDENELSNNIVELED